MIRTTLITALVIGLAACNGAVDAPGPLRTDGTPGTDDDPATDFIPTARATGGAASTWDHPASLGGASISPREALERMSEEGPPAFTARVHGCRKMRYSTIGNVLESLGVDMDAGEGSAGRMFRDNDQALGAPNYEARIPEATELTVASASRLFDILTQAAPEIIAAMPDNETCQLGGIRAAIFDSEGRCTDDGLSCLMGVPASPAHVGLCNDIVARAADPEEGQAIAVASLLAASFTCE